MVALAVVAALAGALSVQPSVASVQEARNSYSCIDATGKPGELQLSRTLVYPGTTITLAGNGFPAQMPVQVTRMGSFIGSPFDQWVASSVPQAKTDDRGCFKFDIITPDLDVGRYSVEVNVGEERASTEFTLVSIVPYPGGSPLPRAVAGLGDNFVRAFYYDGNRCQWAYYDPEFPYESDLTHLITGETYWLLVKEPQKVILNRETRNLTCKADGNCWNRIVW